MSLLKIKVCGMRDRDNIREVSSAGPDFIGFIEYARSPRNIGNDFVPVNLPEGIYPVGVFVDEHNRQIESRAKRNGYTHIQLHGNESPDQCRELKDLGYQVIKVFSVGDDFDFGKTKPYVPTADLFLFDTRGKLHGGNGVPFDWSILMRYDQEVPFFLSGGLSEGNMDQLDELNHMNLYGLDFNSGVEQSPAMKDIGKVQRIMEKLRALKRID